MCICFPCTPIALLSFLLLRPLTQVNTLLGSPIFKFAVFCGVYIKTISILLVLISYVLRLSEFIFNYFDSFALFHLVTFLFFLLLGSRKSFCFLVQRPQLCKK